MTKLAKKGMTPSQIGVVLRDQHGVPQVKAVNGSSVLRILKGMVSIPVSHYLFGTVRIHLSHIWRDIWVFTISLYQNSAGQLHNDNRFRILVQGLAPELPEDLYCLIKKAVSMRKHLELNRKDRDGKFRLILVESRIHRLARYYRVRPTGSQTDPVQAGRCWYPSVGRMGVVGFSPRHQGCLCPFTCCLPRLA